MSGLYGQKHNPYIQGKYGHLNPNDVKILLTSLAVIGIPISFSNFST